MGLFKKIMILVLILAVPGFLYYLLTAQGKNRYKPLSFYGPKPLSGTFHTFHGKKIPDTLYHQAADVNLRDLDGKPVNFKTIGQQVLIISFFYTHGPNAVKQVTGSMDSIARYAGNNKLITLASITVDPQRDTPDAIKAYAAKFSDRAPKWMFLTGDTSAIYPFARKGLLVDALQAGPNDFVCSSKIILLDTEHRIRGYYDGTSSTDLARLGDELKVQIAEELRKKEKPLY